MGKSIAIIGGGVAGLSAGCYGRMNGYETRVFEMHDKPGGLCTSWKRKEYTFDGCIHWLVGSRPGSSMNRIWRELGALPGLRVINHDEFVRVEGEGGKTLIVFTDAGRLERHMKELSPSDAAVIKELTGAIRGLSRLYTPVAGHGGLDGLKSAVKAVAGLARSGVPLLRYSKVTLEEVSRKFKDPFLREALNLVLDVPDTPAILLLLTLAWMHVQDAGYVEGGSLEFSRSIERRYQELGGELSYKTRVKEIIVEGGRAVGILLDNGEEYRSDYVVSAADGHATIFDMLKGRYVDEELRGFYNRWKLFGPILQISLGVARDLSSEPRMLSFPLEEPIDVCGMVARRLAYQHYCFDPTMAPAGKSVVVVYLETEYDRWVALGKDREGYRAEKERLAGEVIAALGRRWPGFARQVEVTDVATPLTYERYTGNWKGSFEGWLPTMETRKFMVKGLKKTLPGLETFYMCGQWIQPGGGLPPAAMTARDVVKMICKNDGRRFSTSVAG